MIGYILLVTAKEASFSLLMISYNISAGTKLSRIPETEQASTRMRTPFKESHETYRQPVLTTIATSLKFVPVAFGFVASLYAPVYQL